jgi:anaerobic ribonucleoside-triphosphate reductase activating protein
MKIALSRVHYPVRSLGPGRRLGIWFQGCSIRCPGCISADTWASDRGVTSVDELFEAVSPWLSWSDGVTVSGGEPFDQPDALHELLLKIRHASRGDILLYTGYTFESLSSQLCHFEGLIDAMITDPFDRKVSRTMALRGSDNQRLIWLTALGEERFAPYERAVGPSDRSLDVMFDDATGEIWFAGIPRDDDFQRLTTMLEKQGHKATTTEDKR